MATSSGNQSPDLEALVLRKPIIVGLYGVPGSGKSCLLNQLKHELGDKKFDFFEGSEAIDDIVPGGLQAFQSGTEDQKVLFRELAIRKIKRNCSIKDRNGLVTGHYMFWLEEDPAGTRVDTAEDWAAYTHLLYLDNPAESVVQRRNEDVERLRAPISVEHVRRWQEVEKDQLRQTCLRHGILFLPISTEGPDVLYRISNILDDFQTLTEDTNLFRAKSRMEEIIVRNRGQLETMLVVDGDRTFAAEDTLALFWKEVSASGGADGSVYPFKTVFGSQLGYSYTAFRQATLLYEEFANDKEFEDICQVIADGVEPHQEFLRLFDMIDSNPHVGAVILTCGLHRIWEKIIERVGLFDQVTVIGGGRIADGLVITPVIKGSLVSLLQDEHGINVWAFGDSPMDLQMLSRADHAVVVVGEELERSQTMDAALSEASFQARQALIPATARPRLNTADLPLINLTHQETIASIFQRTGPYGIHLIHATNKPAAKLLATPARSECLGPDLRDAHHRVGHYLATEYVAAVIGLEPFSIPHAQGGRATGHRLRDEEHTLVVGLLGGGGGGGLAMALGVSAAFPRARLALAGRPREVRREHLRRARAVLLVVDAAVGSGAASVVGFVRWLRGLRAGLRIVVVCGVAHRAAVEAGGEIACGLGRRADLTVVALRLSDDQFAGVPGDGHGKLPGQHGSS
jgi:phosphoserine phosphatase